MGMMNSGARMGLLSIALGLAAGLSGSTIADVRQNQAIGAAMLSGLRNSYRTTAGKGPGNAAALKRASRKRRNIAKNPRALHGRKR